jgi:hypothetical protein
MDLAKTIVVNVDLSLGELYRATIRIMAYALRYLIGAGAFLAVVYVLCLVIEATQPSWNSNAVGLGQWLFPVVIAGVPTMLVMIPIVALMQTRKVLRAEGEDGKRRYTFSGEGVKIESRLANADVKWLAFKQIRESRNYFLLYSALGFASVLPKRCFPDLASMESFRSLVRTNVKKAALQA